MQLRKLVSRELASITLVPADVSEGTRRLRSYFSSKPSAESFRSKFGISSARDLARTGTLVTKALVSIVLVFLCLHPPVQGQSARIYRPDWSIKFNPLATLAYTPGIELGLEHTIRENASIHLGGSYLSDFGIFPNKNFDGYKLIGEYRRYRPAEHQYKNTFLAFRFNFKKTIARGQTYLDRANGNYQQLTEVKVENTTLEFLGAYGRVLPLTPRFSLELSLALGARRLSVASDDVAPDAAFNPFNDNPFDFTVNSLGSEWYPLFRPQFKLNFELY
jgi:hypothetical protein